MCPVEIGVDVVEIAIQLRANNATDPLGIYQNGDGDTVFLTGDQITKYYRYVTKIVFPTILNAELQFFSCYSTRVMAAVLLHEVWKDGPYIKLRLRWLTDCFQTYLRNTCQICAQHTAALIEINNNILQALSEFENNIPNNAVHVIGDEDTDMELEDEDWESVRVTFFL